MPTYTAGSPNRPSLEPDPAQHVLDETKRFLARETAARRIGRGARDRVVEQGMGAGPRARLQQPLLEELAERRPELRERRLGHHVPRQLDEGVERRANRAKSVEQAFQVARFPGETGAFRIVGSLTCALELLDDVLLPGVRARRPLEGALGVSGAPADRAERPDQVRRAAVGQMPGLGRHGTQRRQDGGQRLAVQVPAQRADHGQRARPGRRVRERKPAGHVHRQGAIRPRQPGQTFGEEAGERVERGDEHRDLLERRTVKDLTGHPVSRDLELLLDARVLLDVDGAVRTRASRPSPDRRGARAARTDTRPGWRARWRPSAERRWS